MWNCKIDTLQFQIESLRCRWELLTFFRLLMNIMSKVSSQPQSRRKLKPSTSSRWQWGLSSPPPAHKNWLPCWIERKDVSHWVKSGKDQKQNFPSLCHGVALQECHQQWDICLYRHHTSSTGNRTKCGNLTWEGRHPDNGSHPWSGVRFLQEILLQQGRIFT